MLEHMIRRGADRSRWVAYFLCPFPSRQGFSPYRSPGLLVHVPVMLLFLAVAVLVWQDDVSLAIVVIHALAGLYLGRDLAILAHYNPLLTLGVWGVTAACLLAPRAIASWTPTITRAFPWTPWAVTGLLVLVFAVDVWWWCRGKEDDNAAT